MTWQTPKTWTSEPLTAIDMNTQIRDNMNALKNPPTDTATPPGLQNVTSTSYIDVTDTTVNLTTTGGDVMVGVIGYVRAASGQHVEVRVDIDGTDYPLVYCGTAENTPCNSARLITGVSSGAHSVKLRTKVTGGTGSVRIFQVWAREVS